MEKLCSVAIDGPAGAGKSTLARAAAKRFGFIYVDTGAIYRTVGLGCCRAGVDGSESGQVIALLPSMQIDLRHGGDGVQRMFLNGEDVSGEIRLPEVSRCASQVSAIPEVRAFLMEMQRSLARRNSVVMDGRDIGTVVLPDASVKIFLTADPRERARRRHAELREKGSSVTLDEVLRDMQERDERDRRRAAAPLRAAEDAVVLDTTGLSLEESLERICALIERGLG